LHLATVIARYPFVRAARAGVGNNYKQFGLAGR